MSAEPKPTPLRTLDREWRQELIARRGYDRATVARAKRNARIIQAMLSHETSYSPAMGAT